MYIGILAFIGGYSGTVDRPGRIDPDSDSSFPPCNTAGVPCTDTGEWQEMKEYRFTATVPYPL
jgi:hypothetical protein